MTCFKSPKWRLIRHALSLAAACAVTPQLACSEKPPSASSEVTYQTVVFSKLKTYFAPVFEVMLPYCFSLR